MMTSADPIWAPNRLGVRVLFQVNELSYTGTTKQVLAFCRYLDRRKFEPFLFYRRFPQDLRYRRHQQLSRMSWP